ncbi:MAG: hypothetical protein CL862_08050 [Cyanobium sp. NAT70]|nr:hypothetical protein [Cyanobium sp. NAT70]MAR08640.1 hypothetical protein [Blastopirellula sp.]|tara:strand:+ start:323 stop:1009 length:687 start_codon:yes stop_codon:yes gene_type:complete
MSSPVSEPSNDLDDLAGFVRYMDGPGNAGDNASISRFFQKRGIQQQMIQCVLDKDENRDLIDSRYKPSEEWSVQQLLDLPSGSLGRSYAEFLEEHHFNPHFFHGVEGDGDLPYVLNRLRSTHDIWHVILGFDATEAGECGMNAFTFTQCSTPTTCMLMAAKMIRSLTDSHTDRNHLLKAISDGIHLGLVADSFLAIQWEENWKEPLHSLRKQLKIDQLTPAMPSPTHD